MLTAQLSEKQLLHDATENMGFRAQCVKWNSLIKYQSQLVIFQISRLLLQDIGSSDLVVCNYHAHT